MKIWTEDDNLLLMIYYYQGKPMKDVANHFGVYLSDLYDHLMILRESGKLDYYRRHKRMWEMDVINT